MDTRWRRFAPFGLYLSLAAALVAVVLFVLQREWNLYLQISLGLVVVGLAVFAILDPERVRVAMVGRQARYGSNALVLSLAFVGIVVVANYLVFQSSKVNPRRLDLTEDKQNTLASETISTLAQLPEPVTAQAFFTAQSSSTQAKSLLEQYQYQGKGKFTYEFIDPNNNPVAAAQAKITQDGTIVFTMGERQERVTTISEQELTGAIVRLLNPENRVIYFLTGHGEFSPEESSDQSYSQVKGLLEVKNYTVKTLNLLATNQVPEDARVIIINGPRKPLSQAEVNLLDAYLAKGKAMLVMQDPILLTDFGDAPDPMAEYLSQTWGIVLGNDYIIDQSSNQPTIAVGIPSAQHAITQKLSNQVAILQGSRSVSIGTTSSGVTPTIILSTSQQAWGETDLAALKAQQSIKPDQGVDLFGPVPLALAAQNSTNSARLVVFGNSLFATNYYANAYGNSDLFINSVDWAAGQENIISLTPKETTTRTFTPPAQKVLMNLIMFITVIIIPGSILVAGIVVWVQRRRRG